MLGVSATALCYLPLHHYPQCSPKFHHPTPQIHPQSPSPTSPLLRSSRRRQLCSRLITRASVGSAESVAEPATNVEFPKELRVPGCSESMVLIGTGYREKVFAIIGVKVYAAGFYAELVIKEDLYAWKGKSASEILDDSLLFRSVLQAPLVKSLMIVLVRDVGGKTFWNALNDVISPRIQDPTPVDESALSTFRNTFQERDLKQGTFIFLTWVEPSKMLVSVSSNGFPSEVDANIESLNVTSALFDAFFGNSPVSPSLKISAANGFTGILN